MAHSARRTWKEDESRQEEREGICRRLTTCLGRAVALLDVVSRQDSTNPTYPDLLDIRSKVIQIISVMKT